MDIIQTYNRLLEKEKNLDLLSEVDELRNYCEKDNKEYYYLCTNLIIEIFLNEELLNDALKTSLIALEKIEIEKELYKDPYKKLLDDLAYIYITMQNYPRALEVEQLKKEVINSDDLNEVNRWLLECAYIHEAIGEKNDALMKLKAIVSNNPNDQDKAVALSNLIKLYIDAKDLKVASEKLNECLELVNRINDLQGIRYCKYLQGKIYHLEKNYKNSYKILIELIKEIQELDSENLNYLNEFLVLLFDMGLVQEGLELTKKYYDKVSLINDLENKVIFYKNCLRLDLLFDKKKKGFYDDTLLFKQINDLENEILINKNIITTELRENNSFIESENSAKTAMNKIVDSLNDLDFTNKSSLRNFLLQYSNSFVSKVPTDEIQYLIFDKSVANVLPVLSTNVEMISLYQYKNLRLYERKIGYKNIEKSAALKVFEEQQPFICDLSKPSNSFNDVITLENCNQNYNYLMAMPLFNDFGIFGCVLYFSKSEFIKENFSQVFIKTSSKIFESHLINLLFEENNKLESELLHTATSELNYGLFYYNDYNKKLILSANLSKLLNLNNEVNISSYNSLVNNSDLDEYSKKYQFISEQKKYLITYHLNINNEVVLFREQASPIMINNSLYYVGTIDKIEINDVVVELNKDKVLDSIKLKEALDLKKDKSFTGLIIKSNVNNLKLEEKDDYLYNLFNILKDKFNQPVYLNEDSFIVLFDNLSVKDVKKKFSAKFFEKYNCKYTLLQYPKLLVRLDDFLGLSKYLLDQDSMNSEIEFSNELYANYISVNTVCSCVSKSIVNETVELLAQHVTVSNQFLGYYISPNVMGVYNSNALKVINDDLKSRLDEYVIKNLEDKDFISIYPISLESLLNKKIKNDAKIVFEINSFTDSYLINQVIENLSTTKCKLIISNQLLKVISLNNLVNNGGTILGFNETIDENYLDYINKFISYHYFNCNEGLKVSNVTYKLSKLLS